MNLHKTAADAARTVTAIVPEALARQAARHARLEATELDRPARTAGLAHAIRTRRMPLERSGKTGR